MYARPMLLASLVISCASSAGPGPGPGPGPTTAKAPTGLQSDSHFYKLNSVMGSVTAAGKAVANAQIAVLRTDLTFAVEPTGTYVIEIDPTKYGGLSQTLVFSAPGYRDETRHILLRENNQIRVDVEMIPTP